jgi:hypothetical protein
VDGHASPPNRPARPVERDAAVATCLSQTVGEKAKTGIDVSKCMRLEKYDFRSETRKEARTGSKPRVYAIGLFP